jgi:hypothetical protein
VKEGSKGTKKKNSIFFHYTCPSVVNSLHICTCSARALVHGITGTCWVTRVKPRGHPQTVNTHTTQERTPSIGDHMSPVSARVHTQANIDRDAKSFAFGHYRYNIYIYIYMSVSVATLYIHSYKVDIYM